MNIIFSIKELENMIQAIKKDNPHYKKRIPKYASGIFKTNENTLISHRHIGIPEFKTINY